MGDHIKNKTILVTGGTGSIGSQLVLEILKHNPKQLRVLSRDEGRQNDLAALAKYPKNLRLFIGDVREKDRLVRAFAGVDIVFHAAAMKYVPLCEYNPFEAVKTNILGSQNVIDAALSAGVKKVVAISTDKVANPVGVMGVSKLMMEKLFINANYYKGGESQTSFSVVRFGNVAWARGSVLVNWQRQAQDAKEIQITNPEMTRFLMSRSEAVQLVLKALEQMQGGEIFVFKMPSIKIGDLAKLFIAKYFPDQEIAMKVIGQRAGEKTHEELIGTVTEADHVFENDRLIIIRPELNIYGFDIYPSVDYPGFQKRDSKAAFISTEHLDSDKIQAII